MTGQANLTAARTRNSGGFQGAIGSGSRAGSRQLSQNAVQIQAQNEQLKQAQKQQALSSLQSLYGVVLQTALGYLNSSNSALTGENQGPNFFKDFGAVAGGLDQLATGANQGAQANKNA